MRNLISNKIKRRTLLGGMAALGATHATSAFAERSNSVWDRLAQNRIMNANANGENSAAALDAIDTIEPILSFDTAYNLELAMQKYESIVAAGGWEEIDASLHGLSLGKDGNSVKSLRRLLAGTGDMAPDTRISSKFDGDVDTGVRTFQARHGLVIDGRVGEETLYAMAVPADYRLNQLRINARRVGNLAGTLRDTYVVVNIPAAVIEAVQGATVARRHTAVVGRIDRQTPILSSRIHQINFNPFWHVPRSLIERDLIKYMSDDPEYLTNYNIRAYNSAGREVMPWEIDWTSMDAMNYSFRQDPGAENSMGHVKINFHNPHAVYLHDTPAKSLFEQNNRFHSSGCVRVSDVSAFVSWILTSNGGWDQPAIESVFSSGERLDIAVANPIPIHTTYVTAWANRRGVVSFRDDVYEYDANNVIQFSS